MRLRLARLLQLLNRRPAPLWEDDLPGIYLPVGEEQPAPDPDPEPVWCTAGPLVREPLEAATAEADRLRTAANGS
ncbi:hypothetical protein [Kitasatospora sp. NBC_01302]|uniref:hypothetical protein n=1 Tax=Kitasatospora sp. NBC_01302 TaxID=2903575 RepID=UPI002E0F9205|nr:hypothetical protein OG294_40050 [Kitasatospora sp. NBC_01302]